MLATIREFAREHLRGAGEEDDLLRRHALEFARFAEEADEGLRSGDQLLWFGRLEREHDNLRAALDSSLASGDDETALRLGAALGWFWYAHGHALEGCARLTDLLARTQNAPDELRARPMYGLGVLLDQRGEPERAAELVERSLAIFREQGEQESVARALNSLGSVKRALGELASARSLLEQSIAVRRELGDEPGTAGALTNLGSVGFEQGDLDEAESRFRRRSRSTAPMETSGAPRWRWMASPPSLSNTATTSARASSCARRSCRPSASQTRSSSPSASRKRPLSRPRRGMPREPGDSRAQQMRCANQPASSAAASTASGSIVT